MKDQFEGQHFRREVSNPNEIKRFKTPPEVQLHASATLVMFGDPLSIKEEERRDLTSEVAQFCVPFEAKWTGNIKMWMLDESFNKLKMSIYQKLREHGVMAAGE